MSWHTYTHVVNTTWSIAGIRGMRYVLI